LTEAVLSAIPVWRLWLVGAATFLSCLALPVPASLVMLAAGAFAAAGDLPLPGTLAAALAGALSGDQAGYWIGRRWGGELLARVGRSAAGGPEAIARARQLLRTRGGTGVFPSRWLVSPLGPWVNLAAGAGRLEWSRFALWGAAGEPLWVGLYIGAGFAFAARVGEVGAILGNLSGALAAAALATGLGWMLFRRGRPGGRSGRGPDAGSRPPAAASDGWPVAKRGSARAPGVPGRSPPRRRWQARHTGPPAPPAPRAAAAALSGGAPS
jgi:membrane protein DedA with SNARE-associated domain